MIKNSGKLILAMASIAVLAGCASPVKLDKPAEVVSRDVSAGSSSSTSSSSGQSTVGTIDQTKGTAIPVSLDRVIYFDFDSYVVKDEFRPIVEAHAKLLKADSTRKEVAEGHTDERGGSEYNLALGQRRAEAVVKQMELLGVGDTQLEAVSYGKERPAVQGSDEAAWAKNRRVELRSK